MILDLALLAFMRRLKVAPPDRLRPVDIMYSQDLEGLQKLKESLYKRNLVKGSGWGIFVFSRSGLMQASPNNRRHVERLDIREDGDCAILRSTRECQVEVSVQYLANSLSFAEEFEEFMFTEVLHQAFSGFVDLNTGTEEVPRNLSLPYQVYFPNNQMSAMSRMPEANRSSLWRLDFSFNMISVAVSPVEVQVPKILSTELEVFLRRSEDSVAEELAKFRLAESRRIVS